MKYKEIKCNNCEEKTTHAIWTEDGYGASGGARILTSILSLGMSNLACNTYSKCLSCSSTKQIT